MWIDRNSGEDSTFRIRRSSMWTQFVNHQEDLLDARLSTEGTVKFVMAENTGLVKTNKTPENASDRSNERWVFSSSLILNHKGKRVNPVDVVFHASLSEKLKAPPILKPIR